MDFPSKEQNMAIFSRGYLTDESAANNSDTNSS